MHLFNNQNIFLELLQYVGDVLETGKQGNCVFYPHKPSGIFFGGGGHLGSIFCGVWVLYNFEVLFTKKKMHL